MDSQRPLAHATRTEPVTGEVIDSGPSRVRTPDGGEPAGPGGAEPFLRGLHGLLLGIVTILLAVPAVLGAIAVTVIPIVLWLVAAAVLRVVFRVLAALTGARPEAVMPGAFLRARAVRGFSRAWGGTSER
jgi:hypothetical protein